MENLNDIFKIEDSLGMKGYVILKDRKTGQVIFQKKNMILKEGKDIFLQKMLFRTQEDNSTVAINSSLASAPIIDSIKTNKNIDKYSFYSVELFNVATEVNYKDKYKDIKEYSDVYFTVIQDGSFVGEIKLDTNNFSIEKDETTEHIALKISIAITNELADAFIINSLGIVLADFNYINDSFDSFNNSKKLFSRIMFDPVVVTSDSDLNLIYYVYF